MVLIMAVIMRRDTTDIIILLPTIMTMALMFILARVTTHGIADIGTADIIMVGTIVADIGVAIHTIKAYFGGS